MAQQEINTERLYLRQLTDADAPAIMAIRANRQVNQYLERPKHCTLEDAQAFIRKIETIVAKGDGLYWAITLKDDGQLVGTICYWNLDPTQAKAEIGYELHPDYQGKGYMSEAISAVVAYGVNTQDFELITACPLDGNLNSAKLLDRSGFSLMAILWIKIPEVNILTTDLPKPTGYQQTIKKKRPGINCRASPGFKI